MSDETCIIDYSSGRPNLDEVVAAGYVGVARYLCWLPNSKVIQKPEMDDILAHGLSVTVVWESTSTAVSRGDAGGHRDGAEARKQLDALGWLIDRACYAATDYDDTDVDTAEAYYRAFGAETGVPVGGYGPRDLMVELLGRGAIVLIWEPSAWMHGHGVAPEAAMFQRLSPTRAPVSGGAYDENICLVDDWGQHPAPSQTPQPDPQPPEEEMYQPSTAGGMTFVRGVDGQLWVREDPLLNSTGWAPLGGILTSGPDANERPDGSITVVVRGGEAPAGEFHTYRKTRSPAGVWSDGWDDLGGLS